MSHPAQLTRTSRRTSSKLRNLPRYEIATCELEQPLSNEMDRLGSLPEELLVHTFGFLETSDHCRLRLVSIRIMGPASVCCFRDLKTTVLGDNRFLFRISKLHSSPLARIVRAVHIDPSDFTDLGANARAWAVGQLGFALDRACRFPCLRNVALTLTSFSHRAAWNDYSALVENDPVEDTSFSILLMLFEATARRLTTADRNTTIRELELYGLPPLYRPTLLSDSRFVKGMCAAQKLTLHFGKWCHQPVHRTTHLRKDFPASEIPHKFAANLTKWLAIGERTREKLDLAFADYIGYHPKLHLQNVRYPWLRVLRLNNVTFSHNAQVNWIVGHSHTLRTLHLINCPAIVIVRTTMEIDKEGFPRPRESAGEYTTVLNPVRWATILESLIAELGCLCDFHVSFLRTPIESGRPIDEPQDLEDGMTAGRYKVYNLGMILTGSYSERVHEDHLSRDTKAYIRLLKHTGQWKSGDQLHKEGREEDSTEGSENADKEGLQIVDT